MVLFFRYIKKHKKILFLALILATINQVFSLLDPQIVRIIIDNYATKFNEIPREQFLHGVTLLLLAFIGVAFVSRVAKNFQDYYVNVITQNVGTDIYAESVHHTFSLPYSVFEDRRSGELLQKLQKARQTSQVLITSSINIAFLSLVGIIFVMIYAFIVHWSIFLIYLLSIPSIGIIVFLISMKIKNAQKKIVIESAELSGATTETLRNVELVKGLGLEEQEVKRLNETNKKILELELKKVKLIRMLSFVQGTVINATRAGLMFLMLWLVYNQSITLGEFLSLFFYSFFIFSPLGELAVLISQYQEAKASNEQLEEILSIKPEQKSTSAQKIEKIESIEFKKVSFSYNSNNSYSIKDMGFKINEGETVAFVGPSGSGKSTITKIILGLYSQKSGEILFNKINSKKIDYDDLKKKIGFVAQETQLFAGTIKENLLFVNPNASDEECVQALKMAAVESILNRGDQGLNIKIGEGGIKLSGGERQRLSIARALLRKPQILIFDEATSSLDSLTEKEITYTIKEIAKKRKNLITILIAHRLSTIMHADKIYVLEKGKIIEQGTHKTLLRKNGLYHALWREQSSE